MKILAGVQTPDAGEIFSNGRPLRLASVKEAEHRGHRAHPSRTQPGGTSRCGRQRLPGPRTDLGRTLKLIDRRIYADAELITHRLGLDCRSPHVRLASCRWDNEQLVEIARALSLDVRAPHSWTSRPRSLTQSETERLFDVIDDLKRDGRRRPVHLAPAHGGEAIADRVTVLRDGRNAGELAARPTSRHDAMVRLMVGRDLKQFYPKRPTAPGLARAPRSLPASRVGLPRRAGSTHGIASTCGPGEILGMAGLVGAGRTELAKTRLRRAARHRRARSSSTSKPLHRVRRPTAIAAGVLLVPEDRRLHGLVLTGSVEYNISLPNLDRLSRGSVVRRAAEEELTAAMDASRLQVRTPSPPSPSACSPAAISRRSCTGQMAGPRRRACSSSTSRRAAWTSAPRARSTPSWTNSPARASRILMISSDLEEILGMSDRVLVMHEGTLGGGVAAQVTIRGSHHAPGHRRRSAAMKKLAGISAVLVLVYAAHGL